MNCNACVRNAGDVLKSCPYKYGVLDRKSNRLRSKMYYEIARCLDGGGRSTSLYHDSTGRIIKIQNSDYELGIKLSRRTLSPASPQLK